MKALKMLVYALIQVGFKLRGNLTLYYDSLIPTRDQQLSGMAKETRFGQRINQPDFLRAAR